jgi:hypothetical protein
MDSLKTAGGGGALNSGGDNAAGASGSGSGVTGAGASLLAVAKNSLFAFGSGWDNNRKSQGRYTMEQIASDTCTADAGGKEGPNCSEGNEKGKASAAVAAVSMASAYGFSFYTAAASTAAAYLKKQGGEDEEEEDGEGRPAAVEDRAVREDMRKVLAISNNCAFNDEIVCYLHCMC